jgi:hypothetical protein
MRRLLLVTLLVVACGPRGGGGGAPADGVPWSDYASNLKGRIDSLAASGDCSESAMSNSLCSLR